MLRNPTPKQTAYQDRVVWIILTAQAVLQRRGRLVGAPDWDHGEAAMLPDSAAHTLRFPSGPADVVVSIRPEWFRDPNCYRQEIEAAVEAAVATGIQP